VAAAPGAIAIHRPTSEVATDASAATDARKSGTRGGSAAVGPGAVATSTSTGITWWWYVLAAVAGAGRLGMVDAAGVARQVAALASG
jgi:hypothetical protein